jgi:hypothetical protein
MENMMKVCSVSIVARSCRKDDFGGGRSSGYQRQNNSQLTKNGGLSYMIVVGGGGNLGMFFTGHEASTIEQMAVVAAKKESTCR